MGPSLKVLIENIWEIKHEIWEIWEIKREIWEINVDAPGRFIRVNTVYSKCQHINKKVVCPYIWNIQTENINLWNLHFFFGKYHTSELDYLFILYSISLLSMLFGLGSVNNIPGITSSVRTVVSLTHRQSVSRSVNPECKFPLTVRKAILGCH